MNIKLLCRNRNPRVRRNQKQLINYGKVDIVQHGEQHDGYFHLCSDTLVAPSTTTAWDLAFYNIEEADTIFMEDDVAGSNSFFDAFFNSEFDAEFVAFDIKSKAESPNWPWWTSYNPIGKGYKSFNPFCLLRKSLIQRVLEYRRMNGKFTFHEILFSSLAESFVDLYKRPEFNTSLFRYRPIVTPSDITDTTRMIIHPAKDNVTHSMVALM